MNPTACWVTNRRTIWCHLLVKHDGDISRANEELELYRDADADSEMNYSVWTVLHGELATSMPVLAEQGAIQARRVGVPVGTLTFLWADSIAGWLYEECHG
jgi:hypothetical protein